MVLDRATREEYTGAAGGLLLVGELAEGVECGVLLMFHYLGEVERSQSKLPTGVCPSLSR